MATLFPLARMNYNETYYGEAVGGTEPFKLEGEYFDIAK